MKNKIFCVFIAVILTFTFLFSVGCDKKQKEELTDSKRYLTDM